MERDKFVETANKTVEEAVADALTQLGLSADDKDKVTIEVLDEGSKGGLLGIGRRDCRVKVTAPFDAEHFVVSFLSDIVRAAGIESTVKVVRDGDKRIIASLEGADMGALIGKRGATLDSLQYLVNLAVNKGTESFVNVSVDTENYRERRRETLEILARNLAKKVKHTRQAVTLEPMNANERRIIHSALQGDKFVNTHSEGVDPFRNIIITPVKNTRKPGGNDRGTSGGGFAAGKPDGGNRGGQGGGRRRGGGGNGGGNRPHKPEEKSTLFVSKPLDKRYFDNKHSFNPRPKRDENGNVILQTANANANGSGGKQQIKTYRNDYNKYLEEKAAAKAKAEQDKNGQE